MGNAPAVLLRVNLADLDPTRAENPEIREMFLRPLPEPKGEREIFVPSTEDLQHLVDRNPEAFQGLAPTQRQWIQMRHPDLHWPEAMASRAVGAG